LVRVKGRDKLVRTKDQDGPTLANGQDRVEGRHKSTEVSSSLELKVKIGWSRLKDKTGQPGPKVQTGRPWKIVETGQLWSKVKTSWFKLKVET